MAFEPLAIEQYIYTTLKNDSTIQTDLAKVNNAVKNYQIGVYSTLAPERDPVSKVTPQTPYIIFSRNGSDSIDDPVLCGDTYLSHPLYRITVWHSSSGAVSFNTLKSIAERIDTLLGNTTSTVNGVQFQCQRYDTEMPVVVQQDGRVDFGLSMLFKFIVIK